MGVIEKKVQGHLYCTILHISDKGTLLCKHRKVMPTAAERLVWGFGDGSHSSNYKNEIGCIRLCNMLGKLYAYDENGDV